MEKRLVVRRMKKVGVKKRIISTDAKTTAKAQL